MFAAAIFLPLLGAIVAGFFGRWIGDRGAQIVTCAGLLISMLLGWYILYLVGFRARRAPSSCSPGSRPAPSRSPGRCASTR